MENVHPGAVFIATKFRDQVTEWSSLRGEYAEVLKAEAQAKVEGVEYSQATTITARRLDGDRNALEFTKDSIDLKAKVDTAEKWMWFYALLIEHDLYDVDVTGCP